LVYIKLCASEALQNINSVIYCYW